MMNAHAYCYTHTHTHDMRAFTHSYTHTPLITHTDAIIECPNEMPVSEGSSVDIWCETGLPDSRVVHTTFTFEGRQGICASSYVQVDHSSWRVIRNESEPYTCGLHIDDIQPSDSGEYYCEVNLPGTLNTVRSSICIVQVEGASNPDVILETVIPSVGGLLILVIPALLITVACVVIRRHRHPHHHLISQNPLGKLSIFNTMKYCVLPRTVYLEVFFGSGQFCV